MISSNGKGASVGTVKKKGKITEIIDVIDPYSDKFTDGPKTKILKVGEILPFPSKTREIIYICGPSGSGKSVWASKYIKNYKKAYPSGHVFIFSRLDSDPCFDENLVRVPMDETLLEDPIDIQEDIPANSLVVFDDCDTLKDENIKKACARIMIDILETGRHRNIYCLVTSHLLRRTNRAENATIYNELHRLVIFPQSGNRKVMEDILYEQFGITRAKVRKILDHKTRWLCFGKKIPMYVMWSNGITIL